MQEDCSRLKGGLLIRVEWLKDHQQDLPNIFKNTAWCWRPLTGVSAKRASSWHYLITFRRPFLFAGKGRR